MTSLKKTLVFLVITLMYLLALVGSLTMGLLAEKNRAQEESTKKAKKDNETPQPTR